MNKKIEFIVTNKYLGAFLFFVSMFILKGVGLGSSDKTAIIITLVALLFSLIEVIELKIGNKEFFVWLFVFVFCIINIIMSGKFILCLSVYSIFLLSKTNYKKLYKPLILIGILLLVFLVINNLDRGKIQTRFINGIWVEITKRSNLLYVIYYEIVNLYILIKRERIKIAEILGFSIAGIVLYYYTGTRSGFVCLMFLASLLVLTKLKFVQKSRIIKKAIIYAPMIFLIISLCMNYLYGHYIVLDYVNSMLQNRLQYGKLFLDTYGIPLLGQKVIISFEAETYQVMDNTYLNLTVMYGFIVTIAWSILNIKTLEYLYKHNDYTGICIIIGYLTYAFTESFVLVGFLNMSIFLYCDYISNWRGKNIRYFKIKRERENCEKNCSFR